MFTYTIFVYSMQMPFIPDLSQITDVCLIHILHQSVATNKGHIEESCPWLISLSFFEISFIFFLISKFWLFWSWLILFLILLSFQLICIFFLGLWSLFADGLSVSANCCIEFPITLKILVFLTLQVLLEKISF